MKTKSDLLILPFALTFSSGRDSKIEINLVSQTVQLAAQVLGVMGELSRGFLTNLFLLRNIFVRLSRTKRS